MRISILLLLSIAMQNLWASEETLNLDTRLARLPEIVAATVSFVPPEVSYRTALTEDGLRYGGCTYFSKKRSHIANLVDVLKSANMKMIPPPDWRSELRNGIFLTLADGTEVKFLFGKKYSNQNVLKGEVSHLTNAESITADVSLLPKIYQWAAEADVSVERSVRNEKECGHLINIYKTNK